MNKQKFIEFLRHPGTIDDQGLKDLEAIVKDHPYFHSARTLLAKASKLKKSENAPKYTNSAAIYATDRTLLKKYLNDQLIFLNPVSVHESHEAEHDRDLSEEIKENKAASIQGKLKTNPETPKPVFTEQPISNMEVEESPKADEAASIAPSKEQVERSSNLDNLIEDLYRDMEVLKANREKFSEYERKLEEDEAVDKAVKKATSTKTTPVEKKDEVAKPKTSAPKAKSTSKKKSEATPEKKEAPAKKPAKAKSTTAKKTTKAAAKKTTAKKSTAESKKKTSTAAKKTTSTTRKKPAAKKSAGTTARKEENKDDKGKADPRKLAQEAIISDFIKQNPSISPADGKKTSDVDLSGESTTFHAEIASEYLAQIYLEQGKTDRAKEIYQSLMLKFPEKKSYFAGLIKKLK